MTIQEFCMRRSVPLTRTSRSARALALRALAESAGLVDEKEGEGSTAGPDDAPERAPERLNDAPHGPDLSDEELRSLSIDREVKGFLYVRKPEGHARFSYEVTDPEGFAKWLAKQHGADLLTDRDIGFLLTVGAHYLKAALGDDETWVIHAKPGDAEGCEAIRMDPEVGFLRRLDRTLRKAGAWQQDS